MKFHNQRDFMGHKISNVTNKPLLHKKGKQWIVVAVSALILAGFGGVVSTTTHADTTNNGVKTESATSNSANNKPASASNTQNQAKALHHNLLLNATAQKPSNLTATNNNGNNSNNSSNKKPAVHLLSTTPSATPNIKTRGKWGTAQWTLDNDGNLVISNGVISNGPFTGSYNNNDVRTVKFDRVQSYNSGIPEYSGYENLESVDYSGLSGNVNPGTTFGHGLCNNSKLQSVTFSKSFDTSNVAFYDNLFNGDTKLNTVNNFNALSTEHLQDYDYMFNNCMNLKSIDLSNFDTHNVPKSGQLTYTNPSHTGSGNYQAFHNTPALRTIILGSNSILFSDSGISPFFVKEGQSDVIGNVVKLDDNKAHTGTWTLFKNEQTYGTWGNSSWILDNHGNMLVSGGDLGTNNNQTSAKISDIKSESYDISNNKTTVNNASQTVVPEVNTIIFEDVVAPNNLSSLLGQLPYVHDINLRGMKFNNFSDYLPTMSFPSDATVELNGSYYNLLRNQMNNNSASAHTANGTANANSNWINNNGVPASSSANEAYNWVHNNSSLSVGSGSSATIQNAINSAINTAETSANDNYNKLFGSSNSASTISSIASNVAKSYANSLMASSNGNNDTVSSVANSYANSIATSYASSAVNWVNANGASVSSNASNGSAQASSNSKWIASNSSSLNNASKEASEASNNANTNATNISNNSANASNSAYNAQSNAEKYTNAHINSLSASASASASSAYSNASSYANTLNNSASASINKTVTSLDNHISSAYNSALDSAQNMASDAKSSAESFASSSASSAYSNASAYANQLSASASNSIKTSVTSVNTSIANASASASSSVASLSGSANKVSASASKGIASNATRISNNSNNINTNSKTASNGIFNANASASASASVASSNAQSVANQNSASASISAFNANSNADSYALSLAQNATGVANANAGGIDNTMSYDDQTVQSLSNTVNANTISLANNDNDLYQSKENKPAAKKHGAKIAQLHQPLFYFYALKPLWLHTSAKFTKGNRAEELSAKHGYTLPITRIFKVNGALRFEVKIDGAKYFVTGNRYFARNAYIQPNEVKHNSSVKVLRAIREYKRAGFGKKNFIKGIRKGTVLPIKQAKTVANKQVTRLQLTNGHWITANKNLVKLI